MSFAIWVYSDAGDAILLENVPVGATVNAVKMLLWNEPTGAGKRMAFDASWWMFLLPGDAETKPEGAVALKPRDPFPAGAGNTVNVWVEPKPGAAAPAPEPGPAAAGGAADSVFLPDGSANPAVLDHCIEAVFAILEVDEEGGGRPVCCGFFISPTMALTVHHDSKPGRGAKVVGQRLDPIDGSERGHRLSFVVEKADAVLDVVLMRLSDGESPAGHFLTIPPPRPIKALLGKRAAVIGLGIPTAVHAGEAPGDFEAGLSWHPVDVLRVGKRHFAYPGIFGPGDSGSAIVMVGKEVVGMHLAGWNYAPDDLPAIQEDEPYGAAGGGAAKHDAAALKRRRADDRIAAVLGAAATRSVALSFNHLASTITVGGWALSLVSQPFADFLAS